MFSLPFSTKRSIFIQKSEQDVFNAVGNFNTWKAWSPWLCQEKGCPVEIEGEPIHEGHKQSWDGKRIGSGEMTLEGFHTNKDIDYEINFLKPWKSKSKVSFHFDKKDDGVEVTWTMNGSVPFYLFFLRKMMSAYVGFDYDRGLAMLKEYIETNNVPSDTEVKGEVSKDGFYYIGIKRHCKISEMPEIMENDFKSLYAKLEDGEVEQPENVISFYHKFDMVKGECEFTSAFTYKEKVQTPSGLSFGSIDNHKAIQVVHTGPYRHLGNGWSTVMAYTRAQKLKMSKTVPMYELYLNSPYDTDELELKTEINIAIR